MKARWPEVGVVVTLRLLRGLPVHYFPTSFGREGSQVHAVTQYAAHSTKQELRPHSALLNTCGAMQISSHGARVRVEHPEMRGTLAGVRHSRARGMHKKQRSPKTCAQGVA